MLPQHLRKCRIHDLFFLMLRSHMAGMSLSHRGARTVCSPLGPMYVHCMRVLSFCTPLGRDVLERLTTVRGGGYPPSPWVPTLDPDFIVGKNEIYLPPPLLNSPGLARFGIRNKDALMPDCGVHYLWFAFVCFLIRSHPPSPPPPPTRGCTVRCERAVRKVGCSAPPGVR